MEKKYHQTRGNILTIYDINLEYLYQISYNGIRKLGNESLEKKLYFTICDDLKELRDIYEGDETMEKVTEKLDEMESVLDKFFYYDKEEILKHDSYEMGVEHGIEKGIMQTRLDNAKALITAKFDKEEVIKALNLTPEEVALLDL